MAVLTSPVAGQMVPRGEAYYSVFRKARHRQIVTPRRSWELTPCVGEGVGPAAASVHVEHRPEGQRMQRQVQPGGQPLPGGGLCRPPRALVRHAEAGRCRVRLLRPLQGGQLRAVSLGVDPPPPCRVIPWPLLLRNGVNLGQSARIST
jgi:hypothetical protein